MVCYFGYILSLNAEVQICPYRYLSWFWVCYRWESLKYHAMCCCHGRGSSWRTGGRAEAYEGDTQTTTARCPIPAWQTKGTGLSWAAGWSPFPLLVETRQRESWTAGTCLSDQNNRNQIRDIIFSAPPNYSLIKSLH